MSEATNVTPGVVPAAVAAAAERVKRIPSPEAQAALAKHRERAVLGTAILDVLEAGKSGDLATLMPLAKEHLIVQAKLKAEAEALRVANMAPKGQALAEYRNMANSAIELLKYLESTGVDVEAELAKARKAKEEAAAAEAALAAANPAAPAAAA